MILSLPPMGVYNNIMDSETAFDAWSMEYRNSWREEKHTRMDREEMQRNEFHTEMDTWDNAHPGEWTNSRHGGVASAGTFTGTPTYNKTNNQIGGISLITATGIALTVAGEPWVYKSSSFAKLIFPRSAKIMGAGPMTSVSSLVTRRITISLGIKTGGRFVSRLIPVMGQALLMYDGLDFMWTNRKELGLGVQEYHRYRSEGLIPLR